MPKLLRLPPQTGIPGSLPYAQASPAAFGAVAGAVEEGGAEVTRTSLALLDQQTKIQQALTREDIKLNLAETMAALKDEYARRDIATRGRLGSRDPNADPVDPANRPLEPSQYHGAMAQEAGRLLEMYQGRLKYPESVSQFRAQAIPFLSEQNIKARYEGFKLQNAMLETRDGLLLDQASNQAVTGGTAAERNTAVSAGLDLIRSGVESGRYSGEQGAGKLLGFLKSIDRGTARRDFADDALRENIRGRLMSGTYGTTLPAEEQMILGRTLQQEFTARQRQQDADLDKAEQRKADIFVSRVLDSYGTGNPEDRMAPDLVRSGLQRYEGHILVGTHQGLLDLVNKPELEGGITNAAVFNDFRLRLLAGDTTVTPDSILRVPADQLSARTKGDLLKMYTTAADEQDISKTPFYQKGREQIMVLLGGVQTGMPEFLGLPILKPAERELLAKTLFAFDQTARTDKYRKNPELLSELGRTMALGALGQGPTPTATSPQATSGALSTTANWYREKAAATSDVQLKRDLLTAADAAQTAADKAAGLPPLPPTMPAVTLPKFGGAQAAARTAPRTAPR